MTVPAWVHYAEVPPEPDPEPHTYSVTPVNDRKVWLLAAAVVLGLLLTVREVRHRVY